MTITINGTTGITNDGGYTGDGVSFADTTPANTLVTTTGGNVGIGTSSPTFGAGSGLEIERAGVATLRLENSSSGNNFELYSDTTTNGVNLRGYNSAPIVFWTNNTERARIDASGNLLVGTTSAVRSGDRFSVSGSGAQVASFLNNTNTSGYSALSTILQQNGNNTSTYHLWANTNAVGNWYLYGNGTSSFSSDERLKKNIETTRNGYVEDLCKLRVVKYNWRDAAEGTPKELGLIAQEVEQVFPGLVQDDLNPVEEGGEIYKQVKQSVLPFMLLKAIQEQQAIINAQQTALTALTARVEALEGTQP